MTRFNPEKVLILYSVIGALFLAYVALAPSFSAVYVAVLVSVLFGPCWATIYAGTLDTVDNEHTEMAGAVIVMAIVGARRWFPRFRATWRTCSTRYSSHSWFPCCALFTLAFTSGAKAKCAATWLKSQRPEESNHDNTYYIMAGSFLASSRVSCWKMTILRLRRFVTPAAWKD
ncbi:sugar:proton symporter [Salmonella enterica subsp. enterica]|uniref:Sugar:proton symporter n=1 Tax=Salmonella enterica I TaxID=59201 RepID=A0A3S5DMA0_SALET|nr:sugar:proton symporter [Salmonella enterica subsp. enterica]